MWPCTGPHGVCTSGPGEAAAVTNTTASITSTAGALMSVQNNRPFIHPHDTQLRAEGPVPAGTARRTRTTEIGRQAPWYGWLSKSTRSMLKRVAPLRFLATSAARNALLPLRPRGPHEAFPIQPERDAFASLMLEHVRGGAVERACALLNRGRVRGAAAPGHLLVLLDALADAEPFHAELVLDDWRRDARFQALTGAAGRRAGTPTPCRLTALRVCSCAAVALCGDRRGSVCAQRLGRSCAGSRALAAGVFARCGLARRACHGAAARG